MHPLRSLTNSTVSQFGATGGWISVAADMKWFSLGTKFKMEFVIYWCKVCEIFFALSDCYLRNDEFIYSVSVFNLFLQAHVLFDGNLLQTQW